MKFITSIIVCIGIMLSFSSCQNTPQKEKLPNGQIYLYGETHGVEKILDKEFELWSDYYHNNNMRHLFVEIPYYTAEYLNIWMQEDSDDIFDFIYNSWQNTASYVPAIREFYKKIKDECPETIFHGTDIGHQYDTIGVRYSSYLVNNGLKDSEQKALTNEAIEQGKFYYKNHDDVYRENKMVENFIREFDKLNGESIMGIYGSAHTGLDALDYYQNVPCMAAQLKTHYGDIVNSESLTALEKDIEPERIDYLLINGKKYEAPYYGKMDMQWHEDYEYREYWRLENAYEDFKNMPKTDEILPASDYPMVIDDKQVYVIDYTKPGGEIERVYYITDGMLWVPDECVTEAFSIE